MAGHPRRQAVLKDHYRRGSVYVPPFVHLVGPMDDARWLERIVPEILWLAMLEHRLGPHCVPMIPRLLVEDITPEHVATIMSHNHERIGLISDAGGIFEIMAGRYSNGLPNLDIFLKSYSGAAVRVDRGSRPSILLDHPALSIGLSPQPDVYVATRKLVTDHENSYI